MLKAVKLDPKSIKKAIMTVDSEALPRFVLSELLKFIPTDEEIASLKQYENDIVNLAPAERFMFEISEISLYEQKLKAMYFKSSFPEVQDDVETLVDNLQRSSDDVIQSKKFGEVLRVILALGNYLNGGQRGGAYGFKLNSLLKVFFIVFRICDGLLTGFLNESLLIQSQLYKIENIHYYITWSNY